MAEWYKLVANTPVPISDKDLNEIQKMFESEERRIAQTIVPEEYEVSTVFLGLAHGEWNGKPVLFETMVFDGNGHVVDAYSDRYTSHADALAGHIRTVSRVTVDLGTAINAVVTNLRKIEQSSES